eukprot:3551737-Rhodomonas_salina.1
MEEGGGVRGGEEGSGEGRRGKGGRDEEREGSKLPWYVAETYVYHRLLQASGYWQPGPSQVTLCPYYMILCPDSMSVTYGPTRAVVLCYAAAGLSARGVRSQVGRAV